MSRPELIVPVASASSAAIFSPTMAILFLGPTKAPRAGVMGRVVWTSRFRGPGMVTEGMRGGNPQLVHGPETDEATGSCSLADFYFFLRSTVLHYEWLGR